MKHKSIGMKMREVKSYQKQKKILLEWAEEWYTDQMNLINRIQVASKRGNYEAIIQLTTFMDGMTRNRISGLRNIINKVSDPNRILIDNPDYESSIQIEKKDEISKEIASPEKYSDQLCTDNMDEIVKCYNAGMDIKEIAAYNNMSNQKIIKILVTKGVYSSELYDKIKEMRLDGICDSDIRERLDISEKVLNIYTPYIKGMYKSEEPTENALKIRKYREKHKNID